MRAGDHAGRRAGSGGLPQLLLALLLLPFIPLLSWYGGFLAARGLFNDYDNGLILPFGVGMLLLAALLAAAVQHVAVARLPSRRRPVRWLVVGVLLALPSCLASLAEVASP